MLNVGRIRSRHCQGITRRQLLQVGSLGSVGCSLADLLQAEAAERRPSEKRGAKSVILLWLWGGPSHLDTFDMKPKAPTEYRGPYTQVATNAPGVDICELLPGLAQRADRYTLIRSLHHTSNDHGIAGTIGLTGADRGATSLSGQVLPGPVKPNHGSVISRVLGFEPTMPRFVTMGGFLHQGRRRISGEGGGTLGTLHDPFRLDYHPEKGVQIPQLDLIDGQTPDGLASRRSLLQSLDQLSARLDQSGTIDRLDKFYQQAFSLLTSSKSRQMFDLDQEPQKLRTRYGRFRFGQCCLLARRLVESGARFVQVNWSSHVEPVEDRGDGGWDMHDRNFQQFQDRHAWMLDQALSALLDDLDQRGMLQETIVVVQGEFGRTPKINAKAGRDHWNQCYSSLIAGGGMPGGQVIGASDPRGEHPVTRPVTPADLFTTVLDRVGIGTTDLTRIGLLPLGTIIEELT